MYYAEIVIDRSYGERDTILIEDDDHGLVYARMVGALRGLIGYATVVSIGNVAKRGE